MPNPISFTDYGSEQDAIARRRRMADALQAQSMEQIQSSPAGGNVAPISWTQGLAKMLQAYQGRQGHEQADAQQRELGQRYSTDTSNDTQAIIKALGGRKASPSSMQEDASGNAWMSDPIAAQSPTESLQAALPQMRTPMGQQMASAYLMEQLKPKDLYGKIDAKDYTPESLAKFDVTHNRADLVARTKYEHVTAAGPNNQPVSQFYDPYKPPQQPVAQPVKQEMVSLGGTTQPVNPYSQTQPLSHTVSPDAQLSSNTTIRGQDLTNDRARDANDISNQNRTIQLTDSIRKEFNNLPEVKNYKEVIPIITSAQRAPNTPAGDIDLIYAVGKIMDPGSVVREGELNLVIKSGSPAQRLQGYVSYVQGGGRLAPAQRAELIQSVSGRVNAMQTSYDAARKSYSGMVTSQGIDPRQIFADLPSGVLSNPGANQPFNGPANNYDALVSKWLRP